MLDDEILWISKHYHIHLDSMNISAVYFMFDHCIHMWFSLSSNPLS